MRLAAILLLLTVPPAWAAQPLDYLTEYDPLVVTVPRDRLPKGAVIDPQINHHLLRLLQQRQDARPSSQDALEASVGNLNKLSTATGFKLKTRYTELGFLLTEGLAGTKDFQIASELEKVVRLGKNVQTRAAALVALGYTRDRNYLSLFQGALQDPNVTVRFGALESILLLNDAGIQFIIANIARDDLSPAVRLHAAAGLWKMGDINGREILLRHYQDQDWFVRAMAVRYLGDMGGADEYRKLMIQLSLEQHPMVKSELCSALLRLQRYKDG